MTNTVGVIAAHPDDEILGCGATMAKHVNQGDKVHVLLLGEGATSRDGASSDEVLQLREAAKEANKIIGTDSIEFHDFPDNKMNALALLDIVKQVEIFFKKHQPSIIYTHHAGDVNIDHRCVHDAVVTAARALPQQSVRTLLFFEVLSSTEWQTTSYNRPFIPKWYENVSDFLKVKLNALQAYDAEMRAWPHARSYQAVEHLARLRGAHVGVDAAEAFMLGRRIS